MMDSISRATNAIHPRVHFIKILLFFAGAIMVNSSSTAVNSTPISTPNQSRRNSLNPDHTTGCDTNGSVKPPKFDLLKK